jgi:tetratricopeptide (TPR) repeat protein
MKSLVKRIPVKLFPVFFVVVFCLACQTLQRDIEYVSLDESAAADITELENRIVPLDNAFTRQDLSSLRQRINNLEKKALQDSAYKARLAAWSGRLFLLEGKTGDAGKQLLLSEQLDPGNVQALVLAARLEQDPLKRLDLIGAYPETDTSGELQIERGRALIVLQRYAEAVAAFDNAFARLASREVYRETYQPVRDQAWELRDTGGVENRTAEILLRPSLSWRDIIELTVNETNLLRFLTAGRDWPAGELFNRLLERSFIPLDQDIAVTEWGTRTKPSPNDRVFRSGAAWYLWHLFAENRADRGLLTRYSSRYAARGGQRSPVPDLPLDSPYFDSILGCVEREIMSLPDGRNFIPGETIRGAVFLGMLRKITP